VNNAYLVQQRLSLDVLPRGTGWLYTRTFDSVNDASNYIRTIRARQGSKIRAPEEIAWRNGFISDAELEALALPLAKSGYGTYLIGLLTER
jgi:glucose-1-phosphate thymidylyltransferase